MNSTKYFILLFTLLISAHYLPLHSQNRVNDGGNYFVLADNFFSQVIALPNASLDSVQIIFCYSFVYDGLVFQKQTEDKYFAVPALEATFKDKGGITRKRLLVEDTIYADNFEQTISRQKHFSNYSVFTLRLSDYDITVKLNNAKYSKSARIETKISGFDSIATSPTVILSPFFLKPALEQQSYNFFNSNNYVPFSVSDFTIFFPIITDEPVEYSYKIEKQKAEKDKKKLIDWGEFYTISGKCDLVENTTFNVKKNFDAIELFTKNIKFDNTTFSLLKINVPMATFTPAFYSLTLTNTATKVEKKIDFEVKWNDVPFSFIDPEFAVSQMYLILTDDEYKEIKSGDKSQIFHKIINYWKSKDPTPATQYNEAMTEYFRRVDYAIVNLKTLTQKEGAKSDRGKVYILNGKPDAVSTDMDEKTTKEIWTYNRMRKRYIFEIVSVGIYKLIKVEDI